MGILTGPAERRRSRRRPLREVPQILDVRLAATTVQVVNVSTGGILFDTCRSMAPGLEVHLEFVLAGASRRLRGRVVRCELTALTSSGPQYRVGLRFHQPLDLVDEQTVAAASSISDGFAAVAIADMSAPPVDTAGPDATGW